MKQKFFISLFFLFISVIFAEEKTGENSEVNSGPKKEWSAYIVNTETTLKKDDKEHKLIFREKDSGKVVLEDSLYFTPLQDASSIMDGKAVYYSISHSGGESGGSYAVRVYFEGEYGLTKANRDGISGYVNPEVKDVNNDKDFELVYLSEKFNDYYVRHKRLGNCPLTEGTYIGHPGPYPEIHSLRFEKLKNVSYETQYYNVIKPYLYSSQKEMKTYESKTLKVSPSYTNNNDVFKSILYYYYYMSRYGKEEEALKNVRDSKIKISFSCEVKKGEDETMEKNYTIGLYKFIRIFRQRILWE
ncbi:MAG: hypothetical protein H7A25_24400 [Leptospiraceae bacterium]|nr:hypothetical protein [Leptospiraceae bacterium]MCP5503062.1 hypothetical protein [Leptospiraceae bacterium]